MVLKRILVTALGALGLGVLAAGTASGQTAGSGNIPAPDIFDDQIACSMNVPAMPPMPSMVPQGKKKSPLDVAIEELRDSFNADADPAVLADVTDSATLGLGYVIPPANSNCGRGFLTNDAGAFLDSSGSVTTNPSAYVPIPLGGFMMNDAGAFVDENGVVTNTPSAYVPAPVSAIATDVAAGYSDVLAKFMVVYGDPGDLGSTGTAGRLQRAQKNLSDAIEDELPTGSLEETRDQALEAHNKALAALNAISAGPIYQAGITEWMAKAAVTKAVKDINDQAAETNKALNSLNSLRYQATPTTTATGASKYVPLANTELFGTDATATSGVVVVIDRGMGKVLHDELVQYTNANLNSANVGTHGMAGSGDGTGNNAPVPSNTINSNFDANGNLIIPMEVNTATTDDPTDIRPLTSTSNTISTIRTTVENTRIAAAALKKARDDHTGLNQDVYDEAYRRAKLEMDYYDALWQRILADDADQRTDAQRALTGTDAVARFSISSRNVAYIGESNKLFEEETDLRNAVKAREDATTAVRNAFSSPQNFYQQLVDRRTALKAAADKAVTGAQTDGGTASKALTDAQTAAGKALMDAEEAQNNVLGLFADENDPTVDLINELLATGGDDGQALVDAISATYDTAAGAADAAREVVEELTDEGGAVAMNTQRSMDNANDIEKLDGRVAMNEAEIWDADGMSRIDANETRSMTNATNIATNATNIATNAENIMGLRTDVDSNTGRIMQNETDIMTNAGNIMTNSGRLDAAEAAIVEGAGLIAGNTASIGENRSSIMRNADMIGGLQDQMEIVRAGVAASMALAGMPAINGRGISIGVGSFDGESAFAVGFQIQSDMASFKVGVTSAGGETGASAGVGFQF